MEENNILNAKIAEFPQKTALQSDLSGLPTDKITSEDVKKATETLNKYRAGKQNLENRVISDEQFYKLRHWDEIMTGEEKVKRARPTSAWLLSTIISKHADAMDNYPEPVVLPREKSDEQSAKTLTEILPIVMKKNNFKKVYSDNWYEKLKHGTAVYGVFWDSSKENGLGDVSIKRIDLLNIFWQPSVEDIQESENLFITQLVDNDKIEEAYPGLANKVIGRTVQTAEYKWDESIDTSQKTCVVDWYYKKNVNGKTVLHYVKFAGSEVLYASENDPKYAQTGWYAHGMYPVVFDVMYPEKGTPCGFGLVSITKDAQLYIDELDANILESSLINTRKRWFVSDSLNINLDDVEDMDKQFIPVAGQVDNTRLLEWSQNQLSPLYANIRQTKIDEMKETSANRDVSNGSSGGTSTAAGIAALQESGNKTSRDMISQTYEAHQHVVELVIELIRQFYDEQRAFRVILPNGSYQFINFSNAGLKEQPTGIDAMGQMMYRSPVFDLEIKSVKSNPFSRVEENERAIALFQMGAFQPQRADETMIMLDMMDFEGIDNVKEKISQNQKMLQMIEQMSQLIGQLTGIPQGGQQAAAQQPGGQQNGSIERPMANGISQAQDRTNMTNYGQNLAKQAVPHVK